MSYVLAGLVLLLGFLAVIASVRQRDPRVPFIAILGLIVLTVVAAFGLFVGLNPGS